MNTNVKLPNVGKHTYFNLTMIDHKGSPSSTQIWDSEGNPASVESYLWDQRKRGDDKNDNWARPLIRAYVHITATGETYEFDLTGPIGRPEDLGQ